MSAHDQYEFLEPQDIGYSEDGGRTIDVEIKSVIPSGTIKNSKGEIIESEVLTFKGAKKVLPLKAKCQWVVMEVDHTKNRKNWVGKKIKLTVTFGDWYGSKDAPSIRIKNRLPLPYKFQGERYWGRRKPNGKIL